MNAANTETKAGIYLTNGNQSVFGRLFTGFDRTKKIVLTLDTATRSAINPFGNTVWLKLERNGHHLTGYYSGNGKKWISLGKPINAMKLDKVQPNFNSWVGTSIGLFAEGKPADFDFFVCKDGFSAMPAIGYNNYYGVEAVDKNGSHSVTNTSVDGGWFMISGVDLGEIAPSAVKMEIYSQIKGNFEIWLDDLTGGTPIAFIPVREMNQHYYKTSSATVKGITGHHDVFVKFPSGSKGKLFIKSLRFVK
jgi:xylan 1,4-beta-xylosidase